MVEKIRNGLKFDSLEERKNLEKLNFAAIVFALTWITTHVFVEPGNIFVTIFLIIISVVGLVYGLEMFRLLIKLDYIFAGQFIRDIESISKSIVKVIKPKKRIVKSNKFENV